MFFLWFLPPPAGSCQGDAIFGLVCLTATKTEHEMKRRLLLNIVIRQRSAILQLFSCKNEALLIRWNALLVLNLRLNRLNAVRWFHVERDRLARECLDEDLHPCMV